MDRDEQKHNEKKVVKIVRPTSIMLGTQAMNVDVVEIMEIIDLCTPNMDINVAPVVMITERFPNLAYRLSILPWYPPKDNQGEHHPLLANMPPHQLTGAELARRSSGAFKPVASIIVRHDASNVPSFLHEKYQLMYGDLLERLKVDMSILDYNYTRLNTYLRMLMYEQIRVFNLRPHEIQLIDEKEYPVALEFFLQFDVNMFYMKTCAFRFARPRTLNEGLFCLREPEVRYELAACGNCALCYPKYSMKYRLKKSIVEFSQAHKHTFVNGYEVILNCSASCHTRNVIYALTCPCGKVDYVGATASTLNDRLKKHREHGNRIIHEFLLGQENITRDSTRSKTNEVLRKDRMQLYQHSVRCPAAMQIFLDANPQYWRFIPMTFEESVQSEQQIVQQPVIPNELDWNLRLQEDCQLYVDAVPKAPIGYTFSNRQVVLQTQYFHKKRDKTLPNENIDLYNATLVTLLPESCTDMFRYLIESMFITHAETRLNTFGNVLNGDQHADYYPLDNPWLIRGNEWCQGLVRRPQPNNTTSVAIKP